MTKRGGRVSAAQCLVLQDIYFEVSAWKATRTMASKEQKVEDQSSDRNQLENTGETSNAEQPAPDAPVADVPDPDEADLDDLDGTSRFAMKLNSC